uniref:Uncharacterized protein n=1 Tax=Macrostomum lignano TaxID=282301 RepID=A0A1I8FI11_9PLAT
MLKQPTVRLVSSSSTMRLRTVALPARSRPARTTIRPPSITRRSAGITQCAAPSVNNLVDQSNTSSCSIPSSVEPTRRTSWTHQLPIR